MCECKLPWGTPFAFLRVVFLKEWIREIHIVLFGFVVCRIAWAGEGGSDAVLYGQGGYWYFVDPQ